MKVFKFGGASIKDAKAVQNMVSIVKNYNNDSLLVVVSAMGKTTNALEVIYDNALAGKPFESQLTEIRDYHRGIISDLGLNKGEMDDRQKALFEELENDLIHPESFPSKEAFYDRVVSFGERLSSRIIHQALLRADLNFTWINAKDYIITDNIFKEAKVNWPVSNEIIKGLKSIIKNQHIITQGFIGGSPDGNYTTLGREGSDFSAAIFASGLGAESVTIWKDVPGILNADPKKVTNTLLYENLNYRDAAEMTYYGASVIHPKTIKPLANAGIPLLVRSFENPMATGTTINDQPSSRNIPAIIYKENQHLITFKVRDFTFINENNLKIIFHILDELNIKINKMQNSAISFSICIDHHPEKNQKLVETLKNDFIIKDMKPLRLITIKNHNEEIISNLSLNQEIVLEQKTTHTYQVVVKP